MSGCLSTQVSDSQRWVVLSFTFYGKLRLREVKQLVHDDTARMW